MILTVAKPRTPASILVPRNPQFQPTRPRRQNVPSCSERGRKSVRAGKPCDRPRLQIFVLMPHARSAHHPRSASNKTNNPKPAKVDVARSKTARKLSRLQPKTTPSKAPHYLSFGFYVASEIPLHFFIAFGVEIRHLHFFGDSQVPTVRAAGRATYAMLFADGIPVRRLSGRTLCPELKSNIPNCRRGKA